MNLDDFRCMRRGVHLSVVNSADAKLLAPVNQRNGKNKRALLLLHGFSSTPAVFRHLLASFSDYDAIVIPALPGHAESLDAFAEMKRADLVSYVEKICADLIQEFEQVDVMGLSLGGVLAYHLSTRFPLNHLYLLAPAFDLHLAIPKAIKLARFCKWLGFSQLYSVAGNLYTSHSGEIAYRLLPLTSIIELLSLIGEFEFTPPSCPTDVFLGSHDEVVASPYVAERFINCSNATIHWLENSAHVIPLDGDLDAIINCVKKNQLPA
ncbi:MAG: alpha/beta fold hydrolase [Legionella sp.]|nr:alpha/beta fold hydrolase [Legionella sp.]